jgi:hypothetical protein
MAKRAERTYGKADWKPRANLGPAVERRLARPAKKSPQPPPLISRPNIEVKTWGEIKAMIEAQGVTDADPVFMVDIGPDLERIFISRDYMGQVEIADEPLFSPPPQGTPPSVPPAWGRRRRTPSAGPLAVC